MAQPVVSTYTVGAGQPIHGGRWPGGLLSGNVDLAAALLGGGLDTQPSDMGGTVVLGDAVASGALAPAPMPTVAFVGDSLTAISYGPLHPYTWAVGLSGGVLKPVANCGVASDTIQNVIDRIDNDYTHWNPGLAGLPSLGWAFLRIGTNNFRGGESISSGTQAQYQLLIAKMLTYAQRVVVFCVPPVGAVGDTNGQGIPGVNSWLSSYCASDARLHFVDDCVNVRVGGNWLPGYAPFDGVHFSNAGSYRMGIDGGAALSALLAPYSYTSPVSSDPADVYPDQPQWALNPAMLGADGANYTGPGEAPSAWYVNSYGSGYAATTSIVAADPGDAIQASWLRVTPSQLGATDGWLNAAVALNATAASTISAIAPDVLELVVQIRFNGFAGAWCKFLECYVMGANNEQLTPPAYLRMGDAEPIAQTVVLRQALRRSAARLAHSSASVECHIQAAAVHAGAVGSFDLRCFTVRAS